MKGVFVTGTDTGIGKTITCAALMNRYRPLAKVGGTSLGYWKPVQTGSPPDDDPGEVKRLANCNDQEIWAPSARFAPPVSPHLAAALAGVRLDIAGLQDLAPLEETGTTEGALPTNFARWIVEGAGGVLVPLNETQMMTDWIMHLGLPVVVAARSTLGTINHTLLTVEALRARCIRSQGVIMVGPLHSDNRRAIERYGNLPVLGEMPMFPMLDADTLARWSEQHLDPDAHLKEFLA